MIVNFFNIIAFVSEESTLCNGQEAMGFGKDIVFISPVEIVILFVCLVGSGMDTEFTVPVCFRLVVRVKLTGKKGLGIVL